MKKTKIICSIGPSTQKWENFKGIVEAGMNVARINFSHATLEERRLDESLVKRANEELGANIAILYDTKGPDLRTCNFLDDKIELVAGNTIRITEEEVIGTSEVISLNYRGVLKDVRVGMTILVDDGFYKLVVEEVVEENGVVTEVVCRIINGGVIKSRRGVCIPGIKLDVPYISDVDREDIKYACENDGDYLAISFVNCKEDVLAVKDLCREFGKPNMQIVSKVETKYAMDNLDEIVDASDVIMVARGDLGIETGVENLPLYQKMMVDKCREKGKRVIMATQMMHSMKKNIRPTNAEVTDVANAILLGCDAIMTSDETTIGDYPVETIKNMAEICTRVEGFYKYQRLNNNKTSDIASVIADSAVSASDEMDAKLIVASTMSGYTANKISNLRPNCLVLSPVPSEKVAKSLTLSYGVYPVITNVYSSTDELIDDAIVKAKEFIDLEKEDKIVIVGGFPPNSGKKITNFMKIEEI